MRVCDRLKLYITEKGFKQKAIADKAGLTETQMTLILQGNRSISADELEVICAAMDTTPSVIYNIGK